MRYSEITETRPIVELISNWTDGYDASDVWTGGRLALDREVIATCAGLNHRVEGMLYRGQGIADELAETLKTGGSGRTEKTKTLLTSWTKSEEIARQFARVAHDNHGMSAAVIAVPASHLNVVVDVTQIPGADHREQEVICLHETIMLTPDNVRYVIVYDEDKG